MRSHSPAKSDFSLSKFPPQKISNMNREEYAHQRNLILDKNLAKNQNDSPDNTSSKVKNPEVSLKGSITNSSLRHNTNLETLYIQEQQSRKQLQTQYDGLQKSLQKMIDNKRQMEKNYEEYLKNVEDEKQKYSKYE